MKDDAWQEIRCPEVEIPHDERGEEGQERTGIAKYHQPWQVHTCEEDADQKDGQLRIAESLLQEAPEIHLFRQGHAEELIDERSRCRKSNSPAPEYHDGPIRRHKYDYSNNADEGVAATESPSDLAL